MTSPLQTTASYLNAVKVAAFADHTDVTAGLKVAAGVATREQMPITALRTDTIANNLGHLSPEPVKILLLGAVDAAMITNLRRAADALEEALARDEAAASR
jgi:hypothetical protein